VSNLDIVRDVITTALPASTSVALAASGEMITERSGVLNLGQEGLLSISAAAAFIIGTQYTNPYLALFVGALVGAFFGMLYGLSVAVLRANQVLCGLALALGGIGLGNQLGNGRQGDLLLAKFEPVAIPGLSDIPWIGKALFDQDPVVYFTFYILPFIIWFVLFRTRHGMDLRAVGDNPAAADAVGVHVTRMRLVYTTIGAALSGAGGAHLVLGYTGNWSVGVVSGRGWVALAVVIFAAWRPFRVVIGAFLFGAMISLGFVAQARNWGVSSFVLAMLPYLVTLVAILIPAGLTHFGRRVRTTPAPLALTVPYFREER
jgi:simple sugar transport system permease protein